LTRRKTPQIVLLVDLRRYGLLECRLRLPVFVAHDSEQIVFGEHALGFDFTERGHAQIRPPVLLLCAGPYPISRHWSGLPVCFILTRIMYRPLTRLERPFPFHILAAVLLFSHLLDGLELRATDPAPLPTKNYWGDTNRFLDQQAIALLGAVQEVLAQSPPTLPEPAQRRPALLLLDAVLHEADAPKRAPVQEFFHRRMAQAALEMEQTRVESGAVIWKLYDHAFVVRTRTVTLAFDVTRAHSARVAGFALPDALAARLVTPCDALFISHRHGDHADDWVAQQFISQGKPVVAPSELWSGDPFHEKLQHLSSNPSETHALPVQKGERTLQVVVLPGHQGTDLVNQVVWVRTPDGLSFCHLGDQSNTGDFSWLDRLADHGPLDILFPNCWTPDPLRVVRGAKPALVIPGHENELGHSIDHREPYWLTYERFAGSPAPCIVMTWGETFRYPGRPGTDTSR
jgi:L-ascorbate metabolism protein UlaG (beta-lactamase superfamily)